ncbi:MAG: hypothetical protein M1818_002182 [Claussenomyces sp. TS43310]|nr:MAG: hypothetical protein M1818_002182 [Claussenomyces sp. TS43310]
MEEKTRSSIDANTQATFEPPTQCQTSRRNEPADVDHPQHSDDTDGDTSEDDIVYPKGAKLAVLTMALCLAVFLIALDQTIISTAIPKITDEFKALDDIAWYGSAYLLGNTSVQLIFGKVYNFFSIKYTFLIAIGIFELGSVLCGAAPTSVVLIVGRAIAGLGVAGVFSGGTYALASVAGPLLGGVFTARMLLDQDKVSWRWCFYINLPIGAVAVVVIFFFLKIEPREKTVTLSLKEKLLELDLYGTAVFVPSIICLLLALQWGGTKYPWGNSRIIALFVVFAVLFIVFIVIQIWRQEGATVPPRIIKIRNMYAAMWYAFCVGSCFLIFIYYLPIWFQAIKNASAVKSGIMGLPMVVGVVTMSMLSGVGVTVFGYAYFIITLPMDEPLTSSRYYTPFMIAGSVCMAVGAGLITTFEPTTSHAAWIGYPCLFGFGVGLGMQQGLIAIQTVLTLDDVATGTALLSFVQTLGAAVFIGVGQNVFSNELIKGLSQQIPGFDASAILSAGATELTSIGINEKYLPLVLRAYNDALRDCYYAAVAMACATMVGAVLMPWNSIKAVKTVHRVA